MAATKRLTDDGLSTPITVNDVEIPPRAINIESGNYDGGSIKQRQHQAAVALVVRELLRQRADELGIEAADDDTRVDCVIDRDVAIPEADAGSCREYYDKNQARFCSPPLVEARHILLAAAPDDLDERDRQREVAEALIDTLTHDGGAFARLAKHNSACPSSRHGGNLGQLSRGQTVPEFDDKVLALPEGLSRRPIETRYGWHVVEVLHRVDGQQLPFEAVHERIAEYLTERSRRRAQSQYLQVLIADAEIGGIDLNANNSPLLQ